MSMELDAVEAKAQREVERVNADIYMASLNAGERASTVVTVRFAMGQLAADARLVAGIAAASLLPMAYPAAVVFLCWGGLRDL